MKSIYDESAQREVRDRITTLSPDCRAAWGKMSAPQMICHLSQSLQMALGELKTESKRLPIRYPPLKQLIVYVAPFPKNVPTAPELLERSPHDWQTDVAELTALVDRMGARRGSGAWPEHPAFGRLSERAWGVLTYRHMDHHLRQFGA
jgi:hypothetical protein